MTTHDEFTDRLSDYLDDELEPGERAAVDAHLVGCAGCREALAELRRVIAAAGALEPRAPGTDLWPAVASRTAPPQTRVSFSVPQLIAATLLIALMSGGLVWWMRPHPATLRAPVTIAQVEEEPPVVAATASLGDAAYDAAVADLQKALTLGRGRLDPTTVATIEQSLAAIDHALDQARQALENDPSNTYLSGHLLETRRRKLELLRRAAALAMD